MNWADIAIVGLLAVGLGGSAIWLLGWFMGRSAAYDDGWQRGYEVGKAFWRPDDELP